MNGCTKSTRNNKSQRYVFGRRPDSFSAVYNPEDYPDSQLPFLRQETVAETETRNPNFQATYVSVRSLAGVLTYTVKPCIVDQH